MSNIIYVDGYPSSYFPCNDTYFFHEYCGYICVFDSLENVVAIVTLDNGIINYSKVYRFANYGYGELDSVVLSKAAFNRAFYRGRLYIRMPDISLGYVYMDMLTKCKFF